MLSLIEKAHQKYLKSIDSNEYPLTLKVMSKPDEFIDYEINVFATNEDEARHLGGIIQKRLVEKTNSKGTLYDWGFNLGDIRGNKLGLILPWKNIIIKRSVNNGIVLPLKRSASMVGQICSNLKSFKKIPLNSLSNDQIKSRIRKCIYSFFINVAMLLMAIILMVQAIMSDTGFISVYSYSSVLLLLHCGVVFFQINKTRNILNNWRIKNGR